MNQTFYLKIMIEVVYYIYFIYYTLSFNIMDTLSFEVRRETIQCNIFVMKCNIFFNIK